MWRFWGMSNVIIDRNDPFRFLPPSAADSAAKLAKSIGAAIAASFEADGAPRTGAEFKRRYEICKRIVTEVSGDTDRGLRQCAMLLPHALRCELDGIPWEPPKSNLIPKDRPDPLLKLRAMESGLILPD